MEKQEMIRQYERALEMYGVTAQFKMLVEEVGELFAALGKFDRRRVGEKDVITEIADASIMVEQMATLFGYEEFEAEKEYKLQRLKENLDKHEREQHISETQGD
jgi:NTP pyrophosphatase (non-canonical NTP hydrolase)